MVLTKVRDVSIRSIRLLKPKHRSSGEEPQMFLWPHAAKYANLAMEHGAAQPAFSYFFSWEPVHPACGNIAYDLLLSTDRKFKDRITRGNIVVQEGNLPEANIINLFVGTRYYWKVVARNSGRVVAASPVRFFRTCSKPPRWIYVPGMFNMRDMGGWPLGHNLRVRQGKIYRSSELAGESWNVTADGKRILLEDLKVHTDLDLRGPGEAGPTLDQSAVRWVNIPVRAYDILSDSSRESYLGVFKIFAAPANYPIIFHCQGGCDRGGTVSFLLHALLGLDEVSLIRDYELSNRASAWQSFQSFLNALSSFGNREDSLKVQAENYLRATGLSAQDIAVIRAHLTERLADNR